MSLIRSCAVGSGGGGDTGVQRWVNPYPTQACNSQLIEFDMTNVAYIVIEQCRQTVQQNIRSIGTIDYGNGATSVTIDTYSGSYRTGRSYSANSSGVTIGNALYGDGNAAAIPLQICVIKKA